PVLNATVHYADPDFAAINVGGVEMMLHADHTYDKHPWYAPLTRGERRGLGAELRVFGIDPDGVERRARERGANVVQPAATKGHGWREVMVEDPAVHRLPDHGARRNEQADDPQGRLHPAPHHRAPATTGRGAVGRPDSGRPNARLRLDHAYRDGRGSGDLPPRSRPAGAQAAYP